jgi:hypothetical protein
LPAGSVAAKEADRKRDADRKRLAREAAAKVAEPPPLPSAAPGTPPAPAPPPGAVLTAQPGLVPPPVPWSAEDLSGLIDELIEAAEAGRVEKFLADVAEAGLTGKLVKEIEADARFPKIAKSLLKQSIPRLCAKWLNKSGISAEWRDEVAVVTALVLIIVHDRQTRSKLDELIAAHKAEKKRAEQEAKVVTLP